MIGAASSPTRNSALAEAAHRPAFRPRPVGGAAEQQAVIGGLVRRGVDRRDVDLAVRAVRRPTSSRGARAGRAAASADGNPATSPARPGPEVLAGGGQHLEDAGAAGRRRRASRRRRARHASRCSRTTRLRLGLGRQARGLGVVALAQRDERGQRVRAAPVLGSPRNSGTRPSLKNCRRATSARSSWRNSATATAAPGSMSEAASRMTSARSALPAKSSSSASSTRAPRSAGLRFTPGRGGGDGVRRGGRHGRGRQPARARGAVSAHGLGAGSSASGRRDLGHQPEGGRHVVELVVRLQMDGAAEDAGLALAAPRPRPGPSPSGKRAALSPAEPVLASDEVLQPALQPALDLAARS